jgi:hypothetical protein
MFSGRLIAVFAIMMVVLCPLSISRQAMGTGTSHPVSLVEADIYVTKKKLVMRLKCFAEDLELLQGVEPYEDGKYDNTELEEGTADHAKYLLEKIVIMDANGEPLKGKITEIKGFEIPEGGIEAGQLMNYSMGYVIEYIYDSPPEFITIEQEMVAEGALLPSELKILMKQAGSDTPWIHMMKPDMPETFQFDWENQPLGKDASDEDWETWFEEQREKNLGIESYSSVYSFIYITRREVRQEVLIPIASLSTFMEIESKDGRFLEIEEQDALKEKIETLFANANPVEIGYKKIQPKFDRLDFYGLDLRDFAMQADRRKVSMANGRVGVIMSYPAESAPNNVSLTWDLFNPVVRSVDAIVFALDEVKRTQFSKFLPDNTYSWANVAPEAESPIEAIPAEYDLPVWQNFPWLSLILLAGALYAVVTGKLKNANQGRYVIAGALTTLALVLFPLVNFELYSPWSNRLRIDKPKADEIFSTLHGNLFRAFDYSDESQIYDGLSKSIDGELLSDLYLQLNDSLRIKEQGGAIASITGVNLLDGELKKNQRYFPTVEPGFEYRCKWNLVGTIEHWGHIHERTNVYDATFEVRSKDNEWKITSMQLEDAPQGVVKTRVRKF